MPKYSKKTVIFLVNSGDFFGAERVNLEIIKNLRDKYLFYYASAQGMVDKYLEKNRVEHIVIDKIDRKTICRIEREYQPDLFHATDYRASVMCAASNIKTPFISHLHSAVLWLDKVHPYVFIYLFAAMKSMKILTVSDSIEKKYLFSRFIHNKIQCISNPICYKDIVKYLDHSQKKKYDICFTGRLSEEKNPLLFLEIVKDLKKKYPDISAVMIGDGNLRNAVIDKIEKEKMADYVLLAGFQVNPYLLMNQSKIFLLTSRYEGYPLVVLEALTLGLPCVTASVGAIPEILTDKCGFLCKNKENYLISLSKLLESDSLYQIYSKEAKQRALFLDNHTDYMEKIEVCYQDVLKACRKK